MSQKAKSEYLREIKPGYKRADKTEKQNILNEFCQICGYNRKYAVRLLNKKEEQNSKKKKSKKPGRPGSCSNPVILHFLKILLRSTNMICSKRLQAVIPLWLPHYEEVYGIRLSEINILKLKSVSAATTGRILLKERAKFTKPGLSTTRPGSLLKKHIPIKTNQWDGSNTRFVLLFPCYSRPNDIFFNLSPDASL